MENNNNQVSVDLSALRSKILTIDDVYDYCLSERKFFIYNTIGLYFPQCKGFTVEFFYQYLAGDKKVRYINIL